MKPDDGVDTDRVELGDGMKSGDDMEPVGAEPDGRAVVVGDGCGCMISKGGDVMIMCNTMHEHMAFEGTL